MWYRRTTFSSFLGFTFSLALSACGYQFMVEGPGPTIGAAPEPTKPPETVPTLAIVNLQNQSSEPNLEVKYMTYIRREFAAGTGARLVNEPAAADLVFKGQILFALIPTLTFNLIQGTQESRAIVSVRGTVEETRTKKVIWNETVTASSEFFVTRDLQFNRVLQTRALEQAGQFAAQDLATRFLNYLETYGKAKRPAEPAPAAEPPPPQQPSIIPGR